MRRLIGGLALTSLSSAVLLSSCSEELFTKKHSKSFFHIRSGRAAGWLLTISSSAFSHHNQPLEFPQGTYWPDLERKITLPTHI